MSAATRPAAAPALGRAAEAYAARLGWAVLPAHSIAPGGGCTCGNPGCPSPGKHPIVKGGAHAATSDLATIRQWWTRWPWANVAVATGAESGFWVLDVDPEKSGEESLRRLEEQHGPLPDTVEAITGGGGRHILFAYPGRPVPNKVSLAPGLDVRGDGGYIIVAPSLHVTGRRYAWEVSHHPLDVPLAPAPGWLLAMVCGPTGAGRPAARPPEDWRKLVLEGAQEGARNDSITRLAGHLLRRGVDPYITLGLLQAWNEVRCRPPLPAAEVARTVDSIARAELRRRGLEGVAHHAG